MRLPGSLRQRRRHLERDRPDVLPDYSVGDLSAVHPLSAEFIDMLRRLPSSINSSDSRLTAIVPALNVASIEPVKVPIPLKDLDDLNNRSSLITRIKPDEDNYAVPLPVASFIAAPGLRDWGEGRGEVVWRNGKEINSRDLICEYIQYPGKTAPPISGVIVYITPNGSVISVLFTDGTHRLCAARRRGNADIMATDVAIRMVSN